MQDVFETAVAAKIEVTPLSPACGAEISGVDLSKPLSAHEVKAIKDAWGKYLVLVFRGQKVSPVSYTHLDVYKRQARPPAARIERAINSDQVSMSPLV